MQRKTTEALERGRIMHAFLAAGWFQERPKPKQQTKLIWARAGNSSFLVQIKVKS